MEHFDHDHEHAHSGAHTHSHPHTHEHSHEHPNSHTHDGAQALDHNIHHAGELSDIAAQFDGEARHQLLHAVESFDQANGYLSAALELLKGQNKN